MDCSSTFAWWEVPGSNPAQSGVAQISYLAMCASLVTEVCWGGPSLFSYSSKKPLHKWKIYVYMIFFLSLSGNKTWSLNRVTWINPSHAPHISGPGEMKSTEKPGIASWAWDNGSHTYWADTGLIEVNRLI